MAKCTACGRFVGAREVAMCSGCDNKYHLLCAQLKEIPKANNEWQCQACKKKMTPHNNPAKVTRDIISGNCSSTPSSSASTIASFEDAADQGIQLQRKMVTPPNVDLGQEIRLFRLEFLEMKEELKKGLKEIRREVAELSQAVASCNSRIDCLESRITALESQQDCSGTETLQCKLDQTVKHLKAELNDREQEILSSDLEIANLPEVNGENVIHTVELVAKKLGIALEPRDIVFAERVGPKTTSQTKLDQKAAVPPGGRGRTIVVRLARRGLRNELLQSARVRRGATSADLGMSAPPRRFYLNERLTRYNKLLFYRARQAAEQKGWKFTWTKRGRIYTKQTDGKRTYTVRTEADLERIFGSDALKDNNV